MPAAKVVNLESPPAAAMKLQLHCKCILRLWLTCLVVPAAKVVNLESPPAAAVKLEDIKASLEQHKPAVLFLCQVGPA